MEFATIIFKGLTEHENYLPDHFNRECEKSTLSRNEFFGKLRKEIKNMRFKMTSAEVEMFGGPSPTGMSIDLPSLELMEIPGIHLNRGNLDFIENAIEEAYSKDNNEKSVENTGQVLQQKNTKQETLNTRSKRTVLAEAHKNNGGKLTTEQVHALATEHDFSKKSMTNLYIKIWEDLK